MLPHAMPQRNFGRSVARAAASGGGKAYRGRPAVGWYMMLILIVLAGTSLVVYSRQERIHPPTQAAQGPGLNDNWHVAISFDLCGKIQPNLDANSNLASTGIRTFGDGLIYVQPKTVGTAKASSFEGKNANLGTFVSNYPGLTLTISTIKLPHSKAYVNGDPCSPVPAGASSVQRDALTGSMTIETWSSPTAKGKILSVAAPPFIHLTDGMMILVGFVKPGQKLPVPASRDALLALSPGSSAKSSSSSTTSTT